jgi:hypothetical protein
MSTGRCRYARVVLLLLLLLLLLLQDVHAWRVA